MKALDDLTTIKRIELFNIRGIIKLCEIYDLIPVKDPTGIYNLQYATRSYIISNKGERLITPCPVEGCNQDIIIYNNDLSTRACARLYNLDYARDIYDTTTINHLFFVFGSPIRPLLVRDISHLEELKNEHT